MQSRIRATQGRPGSPPRSSPRRRGGDRRPRSRQRPSDTIRGTAAPTRGPLDALRKIIEDHRQFDSTRRILDEWEDLDGIAVRANALCRALDRWADWATGRKVETEELADVAVVLFGHATAVQFGQVFGDRLHAIGVKVPSIDARDASIGLGIEL